MELIEIGGLRVARILHRFVEEEALPGTGLVADAFWEGFGRLVATMAPRNAALMARRDALQSRIDARYREEPGLARDAAASAAFLRGIGYLEPPPAPFAITTGNVDPEIAATAGPQLVVPAAEARTAINAANARWGSLYDALYGTDALGTGGHPGGGYDEARGRAVIARGRALLDSIAPLARGSHAGARGFRIEDGRLAVATEGGGETGLAAPDALAGFAGPAEAPVAVLLRRHGLHVEIVLDRDHPIGRADPAGIADLVLESAPSTIVDLEDAVCSVDAEDKVRDYRNWLGLMRGTLTATVSRDGASFERRLAPDRVYARPDGTRLVLPGRALLMVRNVGQHLLSDMATLADGAPTPETVIDAVVTSLCALHDLRGTQALHNSRTKSVYIVAPKMHGPAEVAFADALFAAVEDLLSLPRSTLKIGIMDEERRTSANLAASIAAAATRVAFINTGFLDRTGDEIRTALEAGPVIPKNEMRAAGFLAAYERRNVEIGLVCGLRGRAQIGKGMWAEPDRMAAMLAEKRAHPWSGASTAWVPSPTAATLHALHYLEIDVAARQAAVLGEPGTGLEPLLAPPLAPEGAPPAPEAVARELERNLQSLLGYVVRFVEAGIGCSKVPDIDGVALMEDRATLRISSQHVANWLRHGLVTPAMLRATLERMAVVVDRQNAADPAYRPMAPGFDGPAFRAAAALCLEGAAQPNGYTEAILYRHRREAKARAAG